MLVPIPLVDLVLLEADLLRESHNCLLVPVRVLQVLIKKHLLLNVVLPLPAAPFLRREQTAGLRSLFEDADLRRQQLLMEPEPGSEVISWLL